MIKKQTQNLKKEPANDKKKEKEIYTDNDVRVSTTNKITRYIRQKKLNSKKKKKKERICIFDNGTYYKIVA